MLELNKLYHMDCMEAMKEMPDNFADLAISDPPYGIGHFTQSDRIDKYGDYKWNEIPPNIKYFKELKRVSKNRIIWGANYYNCFENGKAAIIWNKKNPHPSMSVCEIASVSLGKRVSYFELPYYGFAGTDNNIHPCQKPIALYKWLLKNYAKPGDKILDTHAGSCSSVIACIDGGFDWIAFEKDEDYYKAALNRINNHVRQTDIFNDKKQENIQTSIL